MMPCSLAEVNRHSEGHVIASIFNPEGEGNMFLSNISWQSPDRTLKSNLLSALSVACWKINLSIAGNKCLVELTFCIINNCKEFLMLFQLCQCFSSSILIQKMLQPYIICTLHSQVTQPNKRYLWESGKIIHDVQHFKILVYMNFPLWTFVSAPSSEMFVKMNAITSYTMGMGTENTWCFLKKECYFNVHCINVSGLLY